jgi:transmembrane protein EpsG
MVAVCITSAILGAKYPLKRGNLMQNDVPNPLSLLVPAIWLTWFSGVRENIGDTVYYRHSWIIALSEGSIAKPEGLKSPDGFDWIEYLASLVSEMTHGGAVLHGQNLIFICAVLFVVPTVWTLYKYSDSFAFSIFLFVVLGSYLTSMSGIRQFAAVGILLMGSRFFFHQNWLKGILFYAPFLFLAWSVHSSALIMLPIFFVVRLRAFSLWSYAALAGSVLIVAFSSVLMPGILSALENYSVYGTEEWLSTSGGSTILRTAVAVMPLALMFFYRDWLRQLGTPGNILINVGFLNAAISIISLYNWIFYRLSFYLIAYNILFIGKLFSYLRKQYGTISFWNLGGSVAYAAYGYFMHYGTLETYRSVFLPNFANW